MSRKENKKQRQAIFGLSEIIRQEDEIESLRKKLAKTIAEAQKDSARLDYVLDHLKENTDLHNMTGHPDDNGAFLTHWGTGFAYTTRDDIDAAMNTSTNNKRWLDMERIVVHHHPDVVDELVKALVRGFGHCSHQ